VREGLGRARDCRSAVVGLAMAVVDWRAWDWGVDFEAATMLRAIALLGVTSVGVLMSVVGRGVPCTLP
jgi:hypothetical protein